jgi:hypothetical protein
VADAFHHHPAGGHQSRSVLADCGPGTRREFSGSERSFHRRDLSGSFEQSCTHEERQARLREFSLASSHVIQSSSSARWLRTKSASNDHLLRQLSHHHGLPPQHPGAGAGEKEGALGRLRAGSHDETTAGFSSPAPVTPYASHSAAVHFASCAVSTPTLTNPDSLPATASAESPTAGATWDATLGGNPPVFHQRSRSNSSSYRRRVDMSPLTFAAVRAESRRRSRRRLQASRSSYSLASSESSASHHTGTSGDGDNYRGGSMTPTDHQLGMDGGEVCADHQNHHHRGPPGTAGHHTGDEEEEQAAEEPTAAVVAAAAAAAAAEAGSIVSVSSDSAATTTTAAAEERRGLSWLSPDDMEQRKAFLHELIQQELPLPRSELDYHAARVYVDATQSSVYDVEQWLDYIQLTNRYTPDVGTHSSTGGSGSAGGSSAGASSSGGASSGSGRSAADRPPIWVDTPACEACHCRFWLFTRRHHCRCCDRCVCRDCSQRQFVLVGRYENTPVRT